MHLQAAAATTAARPRLHQEHHPEWLRVFHEFGAFVSGIAALPRIVTLHDIQITPVTKGGSAQTGGTDQLQLDLTAKTYRYLDDDEVAAAEADKRKADQAKRHGT